MAKACTERAYTGIDCTVRACMEMASMAMQCMVLENRRGHPRPIASETSWSWMQEVKTPKYDPRMSLLMSFRCVQGGSYPLQCRRRFHCINA